MKKTLNIGALILFFLVVAFVLVALLGPGDCRLERSVDIKAPKSVIYKKIADYNNWQKWSPWADIDSSCQYEYYGSQGQVGAGFRWRGTGKAGEGDMHTVDMVENKSLSALITFFKPWRSVSEAALRLDDGDDGATRVTWSFSQSYTFLQRPIMLLLNVKKTISSDYERGLARLKGLCEREVSGMAKLEVKEIIWPTHTYLASRSTIDVKNVALIFQDQMPKTYEYIRQNKIQMAGPPSGLFYTWDNDSTDLAIAIPVRDGSMASDDYTPVTIEQSRAVTVDYYGPYDNTDLAHDAIKAYLSEKGLKAKSPAIEEYVTDPEVEKDPNKVLTKVYYLVE